MNIAQLAIKGLLFLMGLSTAKIVPPTPGIMRLISYKEQMDSYMASCRIDNGLLKPGK